MGLRCLLGHDFGEVEVEREREEDGNEMVVTIREVETCERCGTGRVISENKEVTSIMTAEEAGLEEGTADAAGTSPEEVTHPAVDEPEEAFQAPEDADEDDAVILEDEAAESAREPGEWPDAEQPRSSGTPMQDDAGTPDAEAAQAAEAADAAGQTETAPDSAEPSSAGPHPDGESANPGPADGEEDDVEILDAEADSDGDGTDDTEAASVAEQGADAGAETDARDATTTDGAQQPDAGQQSDAGQQADDGATADAASASAWPEHSGEDEGFDAETGGGEGVSFSGSGLTPEVESDAADEDAEFIEGGSAASNGAGRLDATPESATPYVDSGSDAGVGGSDGGQGSGMADAPGDVGSGIAREEAASIELGPADADTEYYCPNCGMTRGAGGSSMRAGDICPECRKGYVTERDA